jgi:hypothetical protein
VEEKLLDHSPAAHVRRRLVAARLGTAVEHALVSLLTLKRHADREALGAGHIVLAQEVCGHPLRAVSRPDVAALASMQESDDAVADEVWLVDAHHVTGSG